MAVFLLESDLSGRYQGLDPADDQDEAAFFAAQRRWTELALPLSAESVPRLARDWVPLKVKIINPRGRPNDYPDFGRPCFSARAVAALRDLLEPNGELLPLRCRQGEYWAYNPTVVADVLDHDRSQIDWMDRKLGVASTVGRYAFKAGQAMDSAIIFRLPEMLTATYVTERFENRVRDAGLTGFNFRQLWPPPDEATIAERSRRKRAMKRR